MNHTKLIYWSQRKDWCLTLSEFSDLGLDLDDNVLSMFKSGTLTYDNSVLAGKLTCLDLQQPLYAYMTSHRNEYDVIWFDFNFDKYILHTQKYPIHLDKMSYIPNTDWFWMGSSSDAGYVKEKLIINNLSELLK